MLSIAFSLQLIGRAQCGSTAAPEVGAPPTELSDDVGGGGGGEEEEFALGRLAECVATTSGLWDRNGRPLRLNTNTLDLLERVIDDTQDYGPETRRRSLAEWLASERARTGDPDRKLLLEGRAHLKGAIKQWKKSMTLKLSGESRCNAENHWSIYANSSTILVLKSANKYYYWTVSRAQTSAFQLVN